MQGRLARLGAVTSVVLAATVALAGPAEARRNLGGAGTASCVLPGQAVAGSAGQGFGAICICTVLADDRVIRAVGTKNSADCPPGIPQP